MALVTGSVILFNNAGVSSSSGEVPDDVRADGELTPSPLARTLGLKKVDVLGFSIGGMVAQEFTALQAADLVRKLRSWRMKPARRRGNGVADHGGKADLRRDL